MIRPAYAIEYDYIKSSQITADPGNETNLRTCF